MPNFDPLPGYPYPAKAPFPHGDANEASEDLVKTHNADEGSSHAPTGTSAWSGSMGFGWTFADAFPLDGEVDVTAGLVLDAPSAGSIVFGKLVAIDVRGPLSFKAGTAGAPGSATWESGGSATFLSGSAFTLALGATMALTGNTTVRGVFTIKNSGGPGSLVVEAGTTNPIAGLLSFVSTAEQRMAAGSKITGTIEVSGGSSTITFKDGVDITLDTPVAWSTPRTILHVLSYAGSSSGPDDPDAWTEVSDVFNALCYRMRSRTGVGSKSILEFVDLPPGGVIANITVTSKGTDVGSVTSVMPRYQIVSWNDSSASNYVAHSLLVVDAGSIATFPAIAVQTTIGTSSATTITAGLHYGLMITHAYEPVNSQGMRVYEATMTGTTTKYRKG